MRWTLVLATALAMGFVAGSANARPKKPAFWYQVAHPHRQNYFDHLARGKGFFVKNEASQAIVELKKAIKFEPHEPEAVYWLARSYAYANKFRECAEVYERLLKEHPTYQAPAAPGRLRPQRIDFGAALCFGFAGRLERSVYHYRRLVASGRTDIVAYWNLGDSLHALGRLEEAIVAYELAVAASPVNNAPMAMVHFALGVALDRDGQTTKAWGEIERGLQVDHSLWLTSSVFVKSTMFIPAVDKAFYAGFAFQVKGRRNLAIAYFRKYLSKPPSSIIHAPFHVRARAHVADLGSPALRAKDISYDGAFSKKARARLGGLVLRQAAAMQACLQPLPATWAVVKLSRPVGASTLQVAVADGEEAPLSDRVRQCVQSAADDIGVPVSLFKPRESMTFFVVAL